ncbi:hypothetical protein Mapa_008144 [Marchantia paleacea]|nr:hypothetical protein Mapa_008144 [Marchantia paleacea]
MAAAFIIYLVPASEDYRHTMVSQWQTLYQGGLEIKTPRAAYPTMTSRIDSEPFSFRRFISTESETLLWRTAGLPSNETTIESAIAVNHTKKCRLIVDPLGQAVKWLISCFATQNIPFEVVGQKETRFTTALQLAVRFGKALIVQDVDEIEPLLFPLLRNDLERQNSKWTVRVGGKVVDFDENFQLYLITRQSHLNVPPDTLSLFLQANFTVTQPGLEKQLLALTLRKERPDLEEQNSKLIQSEEKLRLQLLDLEKKLLEELSSSQGDILENQVLIDSLNETKIKSANISRSLKDLASLQETLHAKSRVFEPYAKLGGLIFFLLQDLVNLNPMYCFGLSLYFQLFERALTLTRESRMISRNTTPRGQQREDEEVSYMESMSLQLVELMYSHVSRSLYKNDRLTFAMHVAVNLTSKEKPTRAELTYFIQHLATNEMLVDMTLLATDRGGVPSWIPTSRIKAYNYFKTHLPGLVHSLNMQSARTWTAWTQSNVCETEFPSIAMNLTSFQRLLLIQALRPERLERAMQLYVVSALGLKTFFSPPVVLGNLLSEETIASVPVLLITAPGADPSLELEEFAVHKVGHSNYHQLAMGQGQAQEALKLLQESAKVGSWVCLKNLHLVVSWLPLLEKEIHRLIPHPSFRLWLTTEPHDLFPRSLLEATLKITIEPPPGLKNKLQKAYEALSPQLALRNRLEERLLYLLTILHAVVQERCAFIPQGWTKFYEFSFADLRFGADLLRLMLDEHQSVLSQPHLPHFRGLLTAVIYGGRVDNKVDKAVLKDYVSRYFAHRVVDSGANCSQVLSILTAAAEMNVNSRLPSTGDTPLTEGYADYAEHISSIGELNSPAVLGLPPNIISSLQEKSACMVITQLKAMSSVRLKACEVDQKSHLRVHLSPLLQLYNSTMQRALLKVARSLASKHDFHRKDPLFPICTFLVLELETAESILNAIQLVLAAIVEALKPGTQHMSQRASDDCQRLVSGHVPECWTNLWEGPNEPLEYLKAVLQRASGISKYRDLRSTNGLQVEALDPSTFFNPKAFLSAVCQQAAWSLHTTLDRLKLITVWDPTLLSQFSGLSPVTTLLQIEGATFDGQVLSKTVPETPTLSIVPPCTFAWVHADTRPLYNSFISVPLYDSLARCKLVTDVQVPCLEEEKQQWLLAGIAFFLPLMINA